MSLTFKNSYLRVAHLGTRQTRFYPSEYFSLTVVLNRHMLSGLSRLSQRCSSSTTNLLTMLRLDKRRSIAATATFFSTAVVTTRLLPHLTITPVYAPDWNISSTDRTLLVAQAVPIAASVILYAHVRPIFLSLIIYSYHLSLSLTGVHNICQKSIW